MDGRVEAASFFWVEEYNEQGQLSPPLTSMKRKARSKKMEFFGWASKPLIEFLQSIGKDTSQQISQYDVTDIISKYAIENNLLNPKKKKKIICDDRLHSLFGRKSFSRIKVYDMLEAHYAENQDESDDDCLGSSEEENDHQQQKSVSSGRKNLKKKIVLETPKSCFASIIPDNIKLVYLKRSLVQDLLKFPETFEHKILGSFIRIKSDPNDYLQKNSYRLLQVTGLKQVSGNDDTSTEIVLQASNFIKDIQISTLSDDNFSEEECEDLRQRVKDGLLKRPTVAELEEKALILHEDITKHWLVGELALLQKLIDRANEKGWRRELFEYLERSQLLQTHAEQSRLLREVPKVIADEVDHAARLEDSPDCMKQVNDGSPVSILGGASEVPTCDLAENGIQATLLKSRQHTERVKVSNPRSLGYALHHLLLSGTFQYVYNENLFSRSIIYWDLKFVAENQFDVPVQKQQKLPIQMRSDCNVVTNLKKKNECKISPGMVEGQVIDLSDDEEKEDLNGGNRMVDSGLGRLEWHYSDPQGDIQGPFSITSLKRWRDADYFPPDFKVWKAGQGEVNAVLLHDVLQWVFPNKC